MVRISVASGKGGTGKTTVSVNLSLVAEDPVLVDCDVEEPNCHLFLEGSVKERSDVGIPKPSFDLEKCTRCGKCADFCRYNAIFVGNGDLLFFEDLCHGCGGCRIICPEDAITENMHILGEVEVKDTDGITLYTGRLNVGEPSGVAVIDSLKEIDPEGRTTIYDAPPGTSCSAVETIRDSDFCVLVTEPTPFGLNDLKLAVEVVRSLEVPFGVVINRDGIGDDTVERYCRDEGIGILGRIPNDLRIASLYSEGKRIVEELPEYRETFGKILDNIMGVVG